MYAAAAGGANLLGIHHGQCIFVLLLGFGFFLCAEDCHIEACLSLIALFLLFIPCTQAQVIAATFAILPSLDSRIFKTSVRNGNSSGIHNNVDAADFRTYAGGPQRLQPWAGQETVRL